jgi:AhpD family alkylhydroperoxidase
MKYFTRKILTYESFKEQLSVVFNNLPSMISAMLRRRINQAFLNKIMLAVSSVNGCVYCSWFHAKLAILIGEMDSKEIENILKTQLGQDISEYEIVGIAYALHYAVTSRKPDPEATAIFYESYGKEKANDLMLYIEAIIFANLSGNTFDAFLSRLKGVKSVGGSFWFELLFFILSAPILLPLIPFVKKMEKK